ncbi:MAG: lactate racemase domain-containing protein [Sporomusaceae bacterium]|nr:lactate racemase domain-containing protein [Sporomusaceae bacterium]
MFPVMYEVKQKLGGPQEPDIAAAVAREFVRRDMRSRIISGQKVAVAAGSRGIANIAAIVAAVIGEFKKLGAVPFIVPAMGSHGGATAEGQAKVLKQLGIDEATMGAPVVSSMEVVEIGKTPGGVPVYLDKAAAEAEGVFVVNRVKPHTDFNGNVGSGLTKMVAIGLGNHQGCVTLHTHGLTANIPLAAKVAIDAGRVVGGLAIIENSHEQTAMLRLLLPDEFLTEEPDLLAEARRMMARLPVEDIDVLIVKEMGKNFSGTGMDTNVLGRMRVEGELEPESPRIKRVVVLDLSDKSYGNALGIGLADLTTRRLVDKIDHAAMYTNVLSTSYLERGKIPIFLERDQDAISAALRAIGPVPSAMARVCVIKNTLELETLYVSAALKAELGHLPATPVGALPFTDAGELKLYE